MVEYGMSDRENSLQKDYINKVIIVVSGKSKMTLYNKIIKDENSYQEIIPIKINNLHYPYNIYSIY